MAREKKKKKKKKKKREGKLKSLDIFLYRKNFFLKKSFWVTRVALFVDQRCGKRPINKISG